MKRKLLVFSLIFALLFSQMNIVYAEKNTDAASEVIEIDTAEEFLEFAEDCKLDTYSIGKIVELKADINLLGTDFEPVAYFDGTFYGNGYTISGVYVDGIGSQMGLFRYVGALGVVTDLNVKGTMIPTGSKTEIGGIAGVNYGIINNCTFVGNVCGEDTVGGIAGVNALYGQIIGCGSDAVVVATNNAGGIAGVNQGTISECLSKSRVNIEELEPELEIEGMDMSDLNMAQNVITRNNSGGIAGSSGGLIIGCYNVGTVGYQHVGYNAGGIAGYQDGVIKDCVNRGDIYGRKDVGGIVGQAVPYIESDDYMSETIEEMENSMNRIERSMNHLTKTMTEMTEEMSEAANTVSDMVSENSIGLNQAGNASGGSNNSGNWGDWGDLGDLGNIGELPDFSGLGSLDKNEETEDRMTELKETADEMQKKMNSIESDMNSISTQMEHINRTMEESTEITLEDVSSVETAETMNGVVSGCMNYGNVNGDINSGGIAGTMNAEYAKDPEEDVDITADFARTTRINAVVISCVNYGTVNSKKNCAGGIVGLQSQGLIYACEGYGTISNATGDYLGGVAGQSAAVIEKSYSVSDLKGNDYIGGIAGEGVTIRECLSIVHIVSDGECLGGIAGNVAEDGECKDNYFVKTEYDGIDNISYEGGAEPKAFEELMSFEGIPEGFKQVKVTFTLDGEVVEETYIPYGDSLRQEQFPILEDKEDSYISWPEEAEYTNIVNNITLEAEYVPWVQSIATGTENSGKPLFIAVGKFFEGTLLHILEEETDFAMPSERMNLLYSHDWTILSEEEKTFDKIEGHFYVPYPPEGVIQVWVKDDAGWGTVEATMDGSYVVAEIPYEAAFAIVELQLDNTGRYLTIGAGAVVLILVISGIIVHNKRKKKA